MSKFVDPGDVSNALNQAKVKETAKNQLQKPTSDDALQMEEYKNLLESTPEDERYAAITVKVSKQCRNYWQVEARKNKTSVTELVTKALLKEFGLPEDPSNFLY